MSIKPISANGDQVKATAPQSREGKHDRSAADYTNRLTPNRRQVETVEVLLKMQRDLFNHGRQRAVESGSLDQNPADLEALESHASAMAREVHRTAFDPAQNAHDQLLDGEYRKCLADRTEAEQAEKYAAALVREREEEAAQAQAGIAPPEQSLALPAAATVAIMLTTAPTLHDFIFVLEDDFLSWALSLFGGLFLGLLITLMILGNVDTSGRPTTTNRIGLAAGIFIGIALGALRIKEANGTGDCIFAAALTLLEIGIVIGLEGIAASRRAALRDWAARKEVADQASARLDSARQQHERCQERVKVLNEAIKTHISYVEERSVRHFHINEIEDTARQAVRDGYQDGVAQNRGRILGIGGKQL